MFQLSELINKHYKLSNNIYYPSISEYSDAEKRYWNNISVKDQERFLIECRENGTLNAVRKLFPNYEDIIFEPTRSVGLKFLNIKEINVDCEKVRIGKYDKNIDDKIYKDLVKFYKKDVNKLEKLLNIKTNWF